MARTFGLTLACLLGLSAAAAPAQFINPYAGPGGGSPGLPGPYSRPYTLSPYLNLLGNNNPAVNYYLRVLPEFQRRANEAQVDATLSNIEQRIAVPTTTEIEAAIRNLRLSDPLSGTGHGVRFGDTSPYFPQSRPAGRR